MAPITEIPGRPLGVGERPMFNAQFGLSGLTTFESSNLYSSMPPFVTPMSALLNKGQKLGFHDPPSMHKKWVAPCLPDFASSDV